MKAIRALRYPLATEKAVGLVDRGNTIIYVTDFRAGKKEIRAEFEKMFNVKVARVNTVNMPNNAKKAFIKLKPPYKASDIAIKLKLV
jgi:large subunit ribosomal protein L23